MTVVTHALVGREEELASLVGLLDAAPASAVVAGEAGIGKTALWSAAAEEARSRGWLVLSCRPSEAETRYSFSGLADLARAVVGEVLPELPGPQRRALEAALALVEAQGPVDEGVVAFAFLSLLRRLAERSPVVVAVDDLQWLDEPSLALVRYTLPRLEVVRVTIFVSVRGEVPAWLRTEQSLELELGPLSVGAIHELLRSRLGLSVPRPVLLRVWEASGGNPFFALELARALRRRGSRVEPGDALPVAGTLEGLVHERLELLTPDAEEVCRIVAALAEPTGPLVESADGRRARGVEDAVRAGVLEHDGDRIRFAHPLLASSIAARMTGSARRDLHGRLAVLVADPEARARHLALAAAGPDARVADALDTAARRARARGRRRRPRPIWPSRR